MTTLQLAQRLTRNLTHKDVRTLPPEEQQRMADAINTGLGEYVDLLPELRRAEPRTIPLPAPLSKPVTVTENSAEFAFSPAFADQSDYLGCTVAVSGDDRYNRLAAINTLQGPQRTPTGSGTLSLYGDALSLGSFDDSISGDVMLLDGNSRVDLVFGKPPTWLTQQPSMVELGRPRYWWTEPFNGLSGLNEPLFILRVWPVPATVYDLVFTLRLFPQAVGFIDLINARQMPVPENEEAHLVNLCMPGMFTSPLWNAAVRKNDCMADYERAKSAMEVKLSRRGNTQRGKFSTSRGY